MAPRIRLRADHQARATLRTARRLAAAERAPQVRTDHLLLAMLGRRHLASSRLLAAYGLRSGADVRAELARAERRAGLTESDAAALATLGIDIDAVVRQIESRWGPHALSATAGARRRRRPRFGPELVQVIRCAVRQARERRTGRLEDGHLLLAMTVRPGVVGELLTGHDLTYQVVDAALLRRD